MSAVTIKKAIHICCPSFLKQALARIEGSDIGYRLAKGTFWSMAGAVISRGLMLVATVSVARMLGKTGYGELGMIQSTVGMFSTFAGFGLGLTATKYVAEFRRSDPGRAGRIIGLSELVAMATGGLMALVMFVFAPWLAQHTINAPHLAGVLRIGAIIIFISALNGAQTGALSGFEAFRTIAQVNFFVGLVSFPVLIVGAYLDGVTGAAWALAINLCFNWFFNHLAIRKEARRYKVPFAFTDCRRELPILWKFSLPNLLGSAVGIPATWIGSALLVNQPGGYAQMGIFSAASQWLTLLLFIPSMLGQVILPVLSEQLTEDRTQRSTRTMILAVKVNLLTVTPLIIAASIASPYIMNLYGKEFRSGWPTLVTVLLTAGMLACQIPVARIIAAVGRMWILFWINLGWALSFILTSLVLLHYGALGLASARAISYALQGGAMLVFAVWLLRRQGQCSHEVAGPGE